jgi:hypothetical protein
VVDGKFKKLDADGLRRQKPTKLVIEWETLKQEDSGQNISFD